MTHAILDAPDPEPGRPVLAARDITCDTIASVAIVSSSLTAHVITTQRLAAGAVTTIVIRPTAPGGHPWPA